MLMTSSRVINGFAEYHKVTYFMTYIFLLSLFIIVKISQARDWQHLLPSREDAG